MGGIFSRDATDVYLHDWVNPVVESLSTHLFVRLVLTGTEHSDCSRIGLKIAHDADNLNQCLFYKLAGALGPAQQVLIREISAVCLHNEFDRDIELELRGLFPTQGVPHNEESIHPDYTGRVKVFCPARHSDVPSTADRVLYRPRLLTNEAMVTYAGLEQCILQSRTKMIPPVSSDDQLFELFNLEDPVMQFILSHENALPIEKGDVERIESARGAQGGRFRVKPELLAQIRTFFRDTIFREFRYTRLQDARLHIDLPRSMQEHFYNVYTVKNQAELPNIFLTLKVVYLLITPGERKFKHKEVLFS